MAHTYGRTVVAHTSGAGNPITVSVTVNQGETVLCVGLKVRGATNRAGGSLTWGPYTLLQADSTRKAVTSPEGSAEVWFLENPPAATYTLTIPNTGALTIFYGVSTASAAPGRKSVFRAANGGNNTSTNPTPGAVTTYAGAFLYAVVATGATTWAPSAQAGTIINNTDDGADGTGRQYAIPGADGATTLNWTFATSDDWGAVVVAFDELPENDFQNFMGFKVGDGMACSSRVTP